MNERGVWNDAIQPQKGPSYKLIVLILGTSDEADQGVAATSKMVELVEGIAKHRAKCEVNDEDTNVATSATLCKVANSV